MQTNQAVDFLSQPGPDRLRKEIQNICDSDRKFFTDIDLIVCWDFDETLFAKQGVSIEVLPEEEKLFFGSNFRFVWPGSYNLGNASVKPVIALRRLIQDLQK
jgi:hypothetical protein